MWGLVVAAPLWRSVKKYFLRTTMRSQYNSQPFLRKIRGTAQGCRSTLYPEQKLSPTPQVLWIEDSVHWSYLLTSGAVST